MRYSSIFKASISLGSQWDDPHWVVRSLVAAMEAGRLGEADRIVVGVEQTQSGSGEGDPYLRLAQIWRAVCHGVARPVASWVRPGGGRISPTHAVNLLGFGQHTHVAESVLRLIHED